MPGKNGGEKIGKQACFSELLMTTNRKTGGIEYQRLEQFQRLIGATFQTHIQTGNKRERRFVSLLESASAIPYARYA